MCIFLYISIKSCLKGQGKNDDDDNFISELFPNLRVPGGTWRRTMYLLSHLRVSAAEKHNWYSETVNIAHLCGNKEFICDFKTSLRCREPDGAFIDSHVILTGRKTYLWRLTCDSHKQWKCLARTKGRLTLGPEVRWFWNGCAKKELYLKELTRNSCTLSSE